MQLPHSFESTWFQPSNLSQVRNWFQSLVSHCSLYRYTTAPADVPYISDVAVNPNQRGRGIGKSLVRACEAAMVAKGLTTIYTHTKVDNEGAQALFENGGYTVGLRTLNQAS